MSKDILVTIGLPIYNNEKTLIWTLKSIFAQTYDNWELIVVNDGSSDSSMEIVRKIKDSRVRIYEDNQNKGLPHRLNQIVKYAYGKYLARMDADDIMHPKRIEIQLKFLENHPDIDVVGTNAYVIDYENNILGKRVISQFSTDIENIIKRGLFIHPTVMGKTTWFRQNPYDEYFIKAQDFELWCRTCNNSKFALIPLPLLFYRDDQYINLKKYELSYQMNDMVYMKFANELNKILLVKLLLKNKLKKFAVKHLNKNIFRHLVRKKNFSPLNSQEQEIAKTILNKIEQVKLPGIEV